MSLTTIRLSDTLGHRLPDPTLFSDLLLPHPNLSYPRSHPHHLDPRGVGQTVTYFSLSSIPRNRGVRGAAKAVNSGPEM